jgi:hypothetical protein
MYNLICFSCLIVIHDYILISLHVIKPVPLTWHCSITSDSLRSSLEDSWDSDWLRAGRPRGRSSSPGRVKYFLFSKSSRAGLGSTQPSIHWVPGALYPGVKSPGREADYLPPASAEVKKMWIYTATPPYAFMT